MNIVLIGYRCSGKTTVGKILAKELGIDFVDTDVLIEESAGCSIDAIISREGWDHFRDIEKRLIEGISIRDNLVIATGGGVVMDEANVINLKRNGLVVWLKAEAGLIRKRMEKQERSGITRPSLTGTDTIEEINDVLAIRTPYYEQACDLRVDTTTLSPFELSNLILKGMRQRYKEGRMVK